MTTTYRPMTFKLFIELIRIYTKAASVVPFIVGCLFTIYYFDTFNWINSLVYLVAQVAIALFVTGFNNVQDYYLAKDLHYRDTENIIGREHLSPAHTMHLMFICLAVAIGLGLILVARTNWLLLPMGALAIATAILYTAGPVPFSRFPVGEALSGIIEGFGVFFLTVYMNVASPALLSLTFSWPTVILGGNLKNLAVLMLVGLPGCLWVANIMLANNITDVPQDIKNERYTLPYYLGHRRSLQLYTWLAWLSYGSVFISVILGVLPVYQLLVLVVAPKIWRNLQTFKRVQVRTKTANTFKTAPVNLMLFQGMQVLGLLFGIVLG